MTASRPKRFWWLTLAALAAMAATFALGAWQMSRAAQKLALQAAIDQRQAMPRVDQQALLSPAPATQLLHREVRLRGTWVAQHTVFLDNRQMRGKPGFYVVTPLRLDGSDSAVLVERGWVQRNFVEREKLPPVETPPGLVELDGRMASPPGKLYEFESARQGPIRQNIDLAQFRAETGLALLALSVRQTGGSSQGLLREWPVVASGVDKHYGYAFQWWALSALIAFLYVWFHFIAPRRKIHRA